MPVVYWATVLNGNRTMASLPDAFIVNCKWRNVTDF